MKWFAMSDNTISEEQRMEIQSIRQARRYLRDNEGVLARILNAYRDADARGTRIGYLPDQ